MEGTHENNNSSSTATSFLPLPTTSDHLASVTEQQEQPSFDGLFNRSQSKSSESSPVPLKSRSSDIPVTPHIPGALGQISHVHNPPIRSSTTSSLAFSSPSAISIVEESTRSRFRLTTGQSHALGGTLKATENENGSVESQSLVPDLDTGSSQPSELQAVTNENVHKSPFTQPRPFTSLSKDIIVRDFAFYPRASLSNTEKSIARHDTTLSSHAPLNPSTIIPLPSGPNPYPVIIEDKKAQRESSSVVRTRSLGSLRSPSSLYLPQRLTSLRGRYSSSSLASAASPSAAPRPLPRYLGSYRSAQSAYPLPRSVSLGSIAELQSPALQAFKYRSFSLPSANQPRRAVSLTQISERRKSRAEPLFIDIPHIKHDLLFPSKAKQPQLYHGKSLKSAKEPAFVPLHVGRRRYSTISTSMVGTAGSIEAPWEGDSMESDARLLGGRSELPHFAGFEMGLPVFRDQQDAVVAARKKKEERKEEKRKKKEEEKREATAEAEAKAQAEAEEGKEGGGSFVAKLGRRAKKAVKKVFGKEEKK